MFEDSLFVLGVSADKRRGARRTRYIALASVALQGFLLAGFLVVPVIWPETLPLISAAPKVALLSRPKPVVKVETKLVRVSTTESTPHPSAAAPTSAARITQPIPSGPAIFQASEGPSLYTGSSNAGAASLTNVLNTTGLQRTHHRYRQAR